MSQINTDTATKRKYFFGKMAINVYEIKFKVERARLLFNDVIFGIDMCAYVY